MNTKIINIFCALCIVCGLWSCSDDNVSDLQLSGDCMVESIALDNYEGIINLASRSIVVRLPEVYETSAMQVTKLSISNGASCNVKQGETLNLDAAKVLKVKNGDVFLNWTLSVLHDEARITSFVINDIYQGTIDQTAKTITVYVPGSIGLTSLVPTIVYSQNASITPASGVAQDFTNPVTYTVKNNSAEATYTVKVIAIDKPKALFIGEPSSMNDLDPEAKAACQWMLGNVPGTLYASFADVEANTVDLSECKVIWWHYHFNGGVDGHDQFVAKAPYALSAVNQLRQYYENGGAFFLTRYATNLPSFIGATGDDEWTTPNNCWGQDEDGTFTGYGSVFGNVDAYGDIVEAGAFAKSIEKKKPALLWQHDPTDGEAVTANAQNLSSCTCFPSGMVVVTTPVGTNMILSSRVGDVVACIGAVDLL